MRGFASYGRKHPLLLVFFVLAVSFPLILCLSLASAYFAVPAIQDLTCSSGLVDGIYTPNNKKSFNKYIDIITGGVTRRFDSGFVSSDVEGVKGKVINYCFYDGHFVRGGGFFSLRNNIMYIAVDGRQSDYQMLIERINRIASGNRKVFSISFLVLVFMGSFFFVSYRSHIMELNENGS